MQQAAGDREDRPDAAARRVEVALVLECLGFDAASVEHVAQFGKGEYGVHLAVGSIDGGPLLGHAGAHEDDLDVLSQIMAKYPGHRHHRRDDGSEVRHQPRMVLSHVGDRRRTRCRDVPPLGVLLDQLAVGVGHQIGSKGELVDRVETEGPDHGNQLAGGGVGELGREAGRNHRDHSFFRLKEAEGPAGIVAHLLGVLAADPQAVAAADAARLDDSGLPVHHLDGLGRAFPYACVAHPALFADDGDERVVPGGHQSPPAGVASPSGAQAARPLLPASNSSIFASSLAGTSGLSK